VMKRLREAMRRKKPDLWWGKVVAPSWQRSSTFLSSDSWFSHQTWDDARPPASVLIRPCTSGLLSLRHAEIRPERTTIWVLSRRLKKIRWQCYAVFKNWHSRNVSKTGRNTGSDV
jgi:hypothetical protein